MNKQIEFRGKRIDNGEWVCGYLFQIWERAYILWGTTNNIPNMIEVYPSTIGQFTGLVDKNGKRIYEGDFIQSNKSKYNRFNKKGIYEVYFNEFLCHYALVDSDAGYNNKNGAYDNYSLTGAKTNDFKIIGTIYDKEKSDV